MWGIKISIDDSKELIPRIDVLLGKTNDVRKLEMLNSFKEQAEYRKLSFKQIEFIRNFENEVQDREDKLKAPCWNDSNWDDEIGKVDKSEVDF